MSFRVHPYYNSYAMRRSGRHSAQPELQRARSRSLSRRLSLASISSTCSDLPPVMEAFARPSLRTRQDDVAPSSGATSAVDAVPTLAAEARGPGMPPSQNALPAYATIASKPAQAALTELVAVVSSFENVRPLLYSSLSFAALT